MGYDTFVRYIWFLPRAIQQLQNATWSGHKISFSTPRADTIPHFDSPRADK